MNNDCISTSDLVYYARYISSFPLHCIILPHSAHDANYKEWKALTPRILWNKINSGKCWKMQFITDIEVTAGTRT